MRRVNRVLLKAGANFASWNLLFGLCFFNYAYTFLFFKPIIMSMYSWFGSKHRTNVMNFELINNDHSVLIIKHICRSRVIYLGAKIRWLMTTGCKCNEGTDLLIWRNNYILMITIIWIYSHKKYIIFSLVTIISKTSLFIYITLII